MTRDDVLKSLREHYSEIQSRFGVEALEIFGSAVRDELRDDSDVDIHVRFRKEATFRGYFGLKFYLEALLKHPVDLATEKMLKPSLRRHVDKEMIRVA